MIEGLADIFLAVKTVEEDRVAFHFRMGNLDGDCPAGAKVGAAKDRGHAAAGDNAIDAVMIELFSGADWNPRQSKLGWRIIVRDGLGKAVGTPAIHAHALYRQNADQLHSDIIPSSPLVGNVDQSLRGNGQVGTVTRDCGHLRGRDQIMETVRTKNNYIACKYLMFARFHVDRKCVSQR